jgi:ribose-phosphate pyrophosphokinase
MSMLDVIVGTAHPALGDALRQELGGEPFWHRVERTPDGELLVRVDESARGRAIAVVQPTQAPVGDHLLELLLIGDACFRSGAASVTAVVPYLGYARQNRRLVPGEALGARVFGGALGTVPFDRVFVVDPHDPGIEAGFACPLERVSAVSVLAEAVQRHGTEHSIVVAPDLGAAKLAESYAHRLRRPFAVVHKRRMSPFEVQAGRVVGDVRGMSPILVDDMISTAATIASAIERLLEAGAKPPVTVVATHGLFSDPAPRRLAELPIARVITTDTVPIAADLPFAHEVVPITPVLAESLRRSSGGSATGHTWHGHRS